MPTVRRVFISSTCHDLVDLRAEIRQHLEASGFSVTMSDVPETFEVDGVSDSIAVCLANLRNSDVVIVILSQRYGPGLTPLSTDKSATHVEYDEAIKAGKPVLFFVRDRLMAAYDSWVNDKQSPPRSPWVKELDAQRLVRFIDEHKTLQSGKPNWINLFSTVVDLKRVLQTQLGGDSGRLLLEKLQRDGTLGFLSARMGHRLAGMSAVYVDNYTGDPAMNVRIDTGIASDPKQNQSIGDLGPGCTKEAVFSHGLAERLRITWFSTRCGQIRDTYTVDASGTCTLYERRLLSTMPLVLLGPTDPEPVY